jgi:hypothetical protein
MANPFDVTTQLAAYLHPRVCGKQHDFDAVHCLLMPAAVEELRDELRAAGLTTVPLETVEYLQRAFGELVERKPEPKSPHHGPEGPAYDLYFSKVRVRVRRRDGTVVRSDPMHRWLAEVELGTLNYDHGADVIAALIEPEPSWVTDIVNGGLAG